MSDRMFDLLMQKNDEAVVLRAQLAAMTAAKNKAVEVLVNLARVNDEWTEDDDPTSVLEYFGNIALDAARVLREPEAV